MVEPTQDLGSVPDRGERRRIGPGPEVLDDQKAPGTADRLRAMHRGDPAARQATSQVVARHLQRHAVPVRPSATAHVHDLSESGWTLWCERVWYA